MPRLGRMDVIDARLLLALSKQPRATVIALAEDLGMSRNTIHARLAKFEDQDLLYSFERRVNPQPLGYPLMAFITAQVTQSKLARVASALADIPEVLEAHGISGPVDLLIHVVAADADDLYRIAGNILEIPGVVRTDTALVMRELVGFRMAPLLNRLASGSRGD